MIKKKLNEQSEIGMINESINFEIILRIHASGIVKRNINFGLIIAELDIKNDFSIITVN